MDVSVTQAAKSEAVVMLDSVTIAEMLRVALYEQGVEFAAWKKDHYSKPVLMQIRHGAGVQKLVQGAVAQVQKETEAMLKGLK